MNIRSELGEVIGRVLLAKRESISHEFSLLRGWTEAPDMQSLNDIQEIFSYVAGLCDGAEILLVNEVGASIVGYRGCRTLEIDGVPHFALEFHKRYGSFLLVFRCDEERAVRLYHAGLALYPKERMSKTGMKGEENITPLGAVCSRFARVFSARLDDRYFELRDNVIGRFGIVSSE